MLLLDKLPNNASSARLENSKMYFTGKPCARGHIAPRLTKRNSCVLCKRENVMAWNRANKEKHKARTDRWRALNIEKARALSRESVARWRKANPEKEKEAKRIRYRKNPKQIQMESVRWKAANPERARLFARVADNKRRAAKKKSPRGQWGTADVDDMFAKQLGLCACCKRDLSGLKWEIDHIVPLARGGGDEKSNLQILCVPCNRSKGAKPHAEFMRSLGYCL